MPDSDGKASEELERLSQEIFQFREQILTIGSALNRIEKRLGLIFPTYKKKMSRQSRSPTDVLAATKPREELMVLFEGLLVSTRAGGDSAFVAKIGEISPQDIVALAFELGVSETRKIGIKKAREGIRGRVHESLLLAATREQR